MRLSLLLFGALLLPVVVFAATSEPLVVARPTPARLLASTDALLGLGSVVLAGVSRARARRGVGSRGRNGARVALTLGAIVITYAFAHLAIFRGAFGTGSGRAGALVALVLGLSGAVLAAMTLARRHQTPSSS